MEGKPHWYPCITMTGLFHDISPTSCRSYFIPSITVKGQNWWDFDRKKMYILWTKKHGTGSARFFWKHDETCLKTAPISSGSEEEEPWRSHNPLETCCLNNVLQGIQTHSTVFVTHAFSSGNVLSSPTKWMASLILSAQWKIIIYQQKICPPFCGLSKIDQVRFPWFSVHSCRMGPQFVS